MNSSLLNKGLGSKIGGLHTSYTCMLAQIENGVNQKNLNFHFSLFLSKTYIVGYNQTSLETYLLSTLIFELG